MQGRTGLAALLAAVALGGCGRQATEAPARIEINDGPPPAAVDGTPLAAAKPRTRFGRVRRGTLKTTPIVTAPAPAPSPAPAPAAQAVVRVPRPRAAGAKRFRTTQLRALRAYCASRPTGDPRCVDGRVDERVAFAGLEEAR